MGDTLYPIDSIRPIRARDMIQRCSSLDELASMAGASHGALAYVAGHGLYRANLTPDASMARSGAVARSPLDYYRAQAANVPRFQRPGTIFESRGTDNSIGLATAVEGGLLIEPARSNRIYQEAGSGIAYANGTAAGTRLVFADPILGSCMRLNRTAGGFNDRWGFYGGGGSLSGPVYTSAMLVRAWNATGRIVLYTDAVRTGGGLVTGSCTLALSALPIGEWALLRFRARVGGATLSGSFTTYIWLDEATGGLCDVAMVVTSSGPYLQNVEAPWVALQTADYDAPTLTPLVAIAGASGLMAVRHGKATPTRDQPAGDGYTARVLWQARDGADGFRLAVETDQQLRLTMTAGGNTTTAALAWSSVAVGGRTIVARWSQAAGTLSLHVDGAVVAQATGLAANRFPTSAVLDEILLGHSGAGAESLQGCVSWLAHRALDPGADEANASSASASPRQPLTSLWDFRNGSGIGVLPASDPPRVIRSIDSSVAWIRDISQHRDSARGKLFATLGQ